MYLFLIELFSFGKQLAYKYFVSFCGHDELYAIVRLQNEGGEKAGVKSYQEIPLPSLDQNFCNRELCFLE